MVVIWALVKIYFGIVQSTVFSHSYKSSDFRYDVRLFQITHRCFVCCPLFCDKNKTSELDGTNKTACSC